MTAKIHFSAGF